MSFELTQDGVIFGTFYLLWDSKGLQIGTLEWQKVIQSWWMLSGCVGLEISMCETKLLSADVQLNIRVGLNDRGTKSDHGTTANPLQVSIFHMTLLIFSDIRLLRSFVFLEELVDSSTVCVVLIFVQAVTLKYPLIQHSFVYTLRLYISTQMYQSISNPNFGAAGVPVPSSRMLDWKTNCALNTVLQLNCISEKIAVGLLVQPYLSNCNLEGGLSTPCAIRFHSQNRILIQNSIN